MGRPHPLIAILDDEEHFRRALSRLLKAHAYDVLCFACGEALIAELDRHEIDHRVIDCVLLDLHMPGMSGFDVLAKLKGQASSPPVIVITAYDDLDSIERARALNAFECQIKPVGAPALLGAIERACTR